MTSEKTTPPSASDSTKETFVRDLKGIVGKADHLLRDAGHTVVEEVSATRQALSEKACQAANSTYEYSCANPWRVAAMAVTAGFILGALISRR